MKILFSLIAFLTVLNVGAQDAYKKGDVVADFFFTKILNYDSTASSLNNLKGELTVIDFFGTWCIPCVKALPHLSDLEKRFKNKVLVILISNEEPGKLAKFINARSPFPFPVIADTKNKFISLFQPPSYPYTIVLNKNGEIVEVTDAASLSEDDLHALLNQKATNTIPSQSNIVIPSTGNMNTMKSSNSLVNLSQQFIYAAKTGDSTESLIGELADMPFDTLIRQLQTDDEKKAFWINLYNGYTQVILKQDAGKYKDRGKFFKSKQIEIAGKKFSLDDIEHGILRHSKIKWSLGYLNKIFPGKMEKKLRVATLDYRIHFALNCGAKSCPPIAFYNPENLDHELDVATKAYLMGESNYDTVKDIVYVPTLMSWFRRDFGGKKGIKKLLKKIGLIPYESNPKVKFKKYDWNLFLDHYKTEN